MSIYNESNQGRILREGPWDGTREELETLPQEAETKCPEAEVLWLMEAKSMWMTGSVLPLKILQDLVFQANHTPLRGDLAESEKNEYTIARESAPTSRVYMKSKDIKHWQKKTEFVLLFKFII